jgi:hypothetical protein
MMHPSAFEEVETGPIPREKYWFIKKLCWIAQEILFCQPLTLRRRQQLKIEDGTLPRRIMRGILYRMAFVPVVLVGMVAAIVYANTHPPVYVSSLNPSSEGVYFQPIDYVSQEGLKLEGWLVPVVDAKMIMEEKEKALRRKQAAVVLVHDFAAGREEMLPLVKPLHEMGFVVLVAGLRGRDEMQQVGETFGLNESFDVSAAVEVLRTQAFVAADRIAVIGTGSGATAALLAARRDPAIATVVVHRPIESASDLIARIGPEPGWLGWAGTLCKWSFEMAYRVDAEDLDGAGTMPEGDHRIVMRVDTLEGARGLFGRKSIAMVGKFLEKNNVPSRAAVARN